MRIGALGYSPYIYNTNYVSAESLDKIAPIDDDLVTSGTDYSSLTDDSLNENPLRRGETSNFMDILSMQFQMSQMNASRLIKPAEETAQSAAQDSRRDQSMGIQTVTELMQETGTVTESAQSEEMMMDLQQDMMADGTDDMMQQMNPATQTANMQIERNLFAMQRAAEAYRVNMIA